MKQLEPEMADIGGLLRDARAALKKAKRVDYYALLEVDTCADETEIKKVGLCKCLLPWRGVVLFECMQRATSIRCAAR